jgi:hypothetical protein
MRLSKNTMSKVRWFTIATSFGGLLLGKGLYLDLKKKAK